MSGTSFTNVSVATTIKKPTKSKRPIEPRFELSAAQRADLKEAFDMLDADATGCISAGDLKVAISALGFEATKEEIKTMLADVDKSGSGKLSYTDFLLLMQRKMSAVDTNEEILKAFRLFDTDGRGRITVATLRRVADEMGEVMNDEELREMIAEADRNKKGYVDEEDFVCVVKKTSLM